MSSPRSPPSAGASWSSATRSSTAGRAVGSLLTLSWGGTNFLNSLALPPELQGSVYLMIDVHQGQGWGHSTFTGIDPREAMDVSLPRLTETADAITSVPEPSVAWLLGVAALVVLRRTRLSAARPVPQAQTAH
jgi:hypothetical protein